MTATPKPHQNEAIYDKQVAVADRRLHVLINNLPSAVLVEDQDRNIVLCNPQFCELFNLPLTPEQLVGQNCENAAEQTKSMFVDPENFVAGVDAALSAAKIRTNDLLQLVDGRTLERDYVPVWAGPIYLGHMWNYRDISERIDTAQALHQHNLNIIEVNRKLRQANESLTEFATVASHDLVAPIRRMSMFASLLRASPNIVFDQEAETFLNAIENGGKEAISLVQALLNFARAGNDIEPQSCNVAQAYQTALENLRPQFREIDALVTCDVLPTAIADPQLLPLVFQNLLSNAFRYRREEALKIHVSARKEAAHYVISVADNGRGIAYEDRQQIFGMLKRGSSSSGIPGHGIGLAIIRRLLASLGQHIWVEANEPHGARFCFTLAHPTSLKTTGGDS